MEALILYFVLFFPGVYISFSPEWLSPGIGTASTVPFSIIREFGRTLTYTLPALALLWYLITDKKGLPSYISFKKRGDDSVAAQCAVVQFPNP